MTINFDAIPEEMRLVPHWHHWKVEPGKKGKPTKVPYVAGENRKASSTDPETWTTFDRAVETLNGSGRGLGWSVTPDTGLLLIDIDHSREMPADQLLPWAQNIVDRLGSYAERSPNDGVHSVVRSRLPGKGNKVGALEMYEADRFFSATGNHIDGTPSTIAEADAAWLHRLMKAGVFSFKKNPKLLDLFNGVYSHNSQSEADLALCGMLAELGLSPEDIDGAFRLSGLFREKWDDPRGDSTYGAETIALALESRKKSPAAKVNGVSLLCADNGTPRPLIENAVLLLRHSPEWQGVIGFDDFSQRMVLCAPAPGFPDHHPLPRDWTSTDDTLTTAWMQRHGVLINSTRIVGQAVEAVARENRFHPVRKYLDSLHWDGIERAEAWLEACLGVTDSPYVRATAERSLIAAVARVRRPGCKADCMLVLQGPQGILKSSAVQELFSPPWFADQLANITNKDAVVGLLGKWCIEIAELSSIRRAEIEQVKSFLSRQSDYIRVPYGTRAEELPRQCVFVGTTNDESLFADPTGARRFWPVRCGVINLDFVRKNRDQLWAEADAKFKQGRPWWLESAELNTLAEAEQRERYEEGSRDDLILLWAANPRRREAEHEWDEIPWFDSAPGRINATDVLVHGLALSPAQIRDFDHRAVGRCLRHNGYHQEQARSGKNCGKRYFVRETEPLRER